MANYNVTDSNGETTNHFTPPTVSNPRTNWTTPTVATSASDIGGQITVTTSATAPAAGAVIDVAFGQTFGNPPKAILVTQQLGGYPTAITASGFTLNVATAPAISTAYIFHFLVLP